MISQYSGERRLFPSPSPEVGIFEQKAQLCRDRLNELYARFGLEDLRVLPDPEKDTKFYELSKKKGTPEWLVLKLKTLEGMIAEASQGDERVLSVLERALSEWEQYQANEVETTQLAA